MTSFAVASSSTIRTARAPTPVIASFGILHRQGRGLSTYSPRDNRQDIEEPKPTPKPSSPNFFTGKPTLNDALSTLQDTLKTAQKQLRTEYIYPLPSSLPYLQPPQTSWQTLPNLSSKLQTKIRTGQYRKILDLLNEMHQLRHVARTSGKYDVVDILGSALQGYERDDRGIVRGGKGEEEKNRVDEYGRSFGVGRRKESSARVWIIPTKEGRVFLDQPTPSSSYMPSIPATLSPDLSSPTSPETAETSSSILSDSLDISSTSPLLEHTEASTNASTSESTLETIIPTSQILINHLPLPLHFSRPHDRDQILRPLKITGLLGAFNVFALVRGGGTTGQAGAVMMGLARALEAAREDVRDVLLNDGALMRDTRMVERKKTGLVKARKRWTWVKR